MQLHGQVHDRDGRPLNTRNHPLAVPKNPDKTEPRAKMILVVGTAMNAGKSTAAVAIAWALTTLGHRVHSSKITGTAPLKEILHMKDAGATVISDFTYLGYPSTYLLPPHQLLTIFNNLDLKYANNPNNYWIVEVADGLLQRETALLLANPAVQERIHRLVLCASDAMGAVGAHHILNQHHDLTIHAISGLVANSPLAITELQHHLNIPVLDAMHPDPQRTADVICGPGR